MENITTEQKLQEYIKAEIGDSALYNLLSKIAPFDMDKKLLGEFSKDELSHANEFRKIYKEITGQDYDPPISMPKLSGNYRDVLRNRVLDESGDFRKYGEQYLITNDNEALKNAYYRARTDEAVHALRLLYLLRQ